MSTPRQRLAVAAGAVVVVGFAVAVVALRPTGQDHTSTSAAVTPQQQQFRDLFGPDVPTAPLTVVASNRGPEGTTADIVQARTSSGLCTAVRVSVASADTRPSGSCQPGADDSAPGPVGASGGSWTWVSPTTGISWSGWYGLGATASTVELRLDNQPSGSATPTAGAYVLPAVQDTRAGCRTVVGLDARGTVQQVDYLDLSCDPAFQTATPGS